MNGNLFLNRVGLICAVVLALLLAIFFLVPEAFISPLGFVLLLPGCLFVFIYAMRTFRPR